MATNYPGSLDNFTNPTSSDNLATAGGSTAIPHASQHANLNDAVKAIETKLNISSAGSTAGVVFLDTNKNLVSTPAGTAGQFLMSYGPISNGGPEWISLPIMEEVQAATTGVLTGTWAYNNTNLTLTYTGTTYTIDGYTFVAGDRVLIKDQTAGSTPTYVANGVYVITSIGSNIVLTRDNDSDAMSKLGGTIISVNRGPVNGGQPFICTNLSTDVLGTTAINITPLVTGSATQTLSNKTLSSPIINGTVTVPAPTLPGDIATKSYVDTLSAGINIHDAVRLATTAALTGATYAQITSGGVDATGGYGPGATLTVTPTTQSIDGTVISTLSVGDRILIKNQATATQNGIYSVTTLSPFVLTRSSDADNTSYAEVAPGDLVYVISGTANIGIGYVMNIVGTGTNGSIKIGIDNISWTQYTGSLPLPLSSANGGTGTAGTLTGVLYLNGTSPATTATAAQIVGAISTTAVTNSTNTTNIAIATDAATATTYPLFANSTTSPISPKYNTSLTYNASTGTLSATVISGTSLGGSLLSSATPLINGTAAAGNSLIPARDNHVHPTDTTRAPLASPTFTGAIDASSTVTSFFATPTSITLGAAATTATLFGAGTTISLGASTGTLTLANPTITLSNATTLNINGASPSIVTSSTATASVFNTNALTVNLGGAATTLSLGNTVTAAQTVNIGTASTGASTYNIATGATTNATTKAINIGTSGVSGSTTNISLGSITGTTSIALYGIPYIYQPTITAISANGSSTLTIAQLLTEIITFTGTAIATFTLPTGTLMDGGVPTIVTASTAIAFDWSVVNTVAFTVTMAAGTTHTYVGNTSVAANTSARFRSVRTAATTWVTYRLS